MKNDTLKRAIEIQDAIESIGELRDAFLKDIQLSVNQIGIRCMPPDVACEWREMNVDFLNEKIEKLEQEFNNL